MRDDRQEREGGEMSHMLRYCSIRSQDHMSSLLSLVRELRPFGGGWTCLEQKDGSPRSGVDANLGILLAISEMCPGLVDKAISLIDHGKIRVYIERTSHRRLYLMETTTKGQDTSYLVMRHFCTCRSYIDKVVLQKKEITCKHELAYYLLDSMYIPEVIDGRLPSLNDHVLREPGTVGSRCDEEQQGEQGVKRGNSRETVLPLVGSTNPLIKVHMVDEARFSEIYLEHTSRFFVENGFFKRVISNRRQTTGGEKLGGEIYNMH